MSDPTEEEERIWLDDGGVLIINGDVPLDTSKIRRKEVEGHAKQPCAHQ